MALKLSASDKKNIVELYRHPEESTATLASRYGVSSSTISRILKQALSTDEYQEIVQQKKGGGSKPQSRKEEVAPAPAVVKTKKTKSKKPSKTKAPTPDTDAVNTDEQTQTPKPSKSGSRRSRTRKRSSAKDQDASEVTTSPNETQLDLMDANVSEKSTDAQTDDSRLDAVTQEETDAPSDVSPQIDTVELTETSDDEELHEIHADLLEEDFSEDEDEFDDEEDEFDEDDDEQEDGAEPALPIDVEQLSILPFSEAKLPRSCYLIIDRSAELITRPLKTFADLGAVPEDEVDEPTLPIFDNHRVAKRFANRRTQRIVKVPDAQVLHKTSSYLMDKGITRLLLDGQVYTLIDDLEADDVD